MLYDPATVEACAKVARECFDHPQAAADPDYIPAAIRSLTAGREIQSSDGGLNGQARNPVRLPDSSGDLASAGIAGVDIKDHRRQVGTAPSETIPSGYTEYTPVTVRAHTVVRQDCAPAGTVSDANWLGDWIVSVEPEIYRGRAARLARALLSQFDIRRK